MKKWSKGKKRKMKIGEFIQVSPYQCDLLIKQPKAKILDFAFDDSYLKMF